MKKKRPIKNKAAAKVVPAVKAAPWDNMTNWFILLIVGLPIVYTTLTPEPVVPIRNIILSAFLLLFGLHFFVFKKQDILLQGKYPIWFFISLGFFWIWSCLASISAINVQESLFALGRNISLFALMLLVYQAARKETQFSSSVFKALTIIGLFHAIIGIGQFYGLILPKEPGVVPQAFAANRSLYGSAMMLLLPFAGAVLMTSGKGWRAVAGLAIALELASIILSQTRSAWVALFIAFLVVHGLIIFNRNKMDKKMLRWWWWSNLAGIILLLLTGFILAQLDAGGWLMDSLVNRVKSLFGVAAADSVAASNVSERLILWQKSLVMLGDYPILGTGPGNWKMVAPLYISDIPAIARGDYYLVRPHNSWLQVFVETGLPGGIVFVIAWVLLFVMAFRNTISASKQTNLIFSIFLAAGTVGFATDMCFSFPDERPEHGLYLSLMVGLVLANFSKNDNSKRGFKWPLPAILVILAFVFAHLLLSRVHFKYQVAYQKAYSAQVYNKYAEVIEAVENNRTFWITLGPNADPAELFSSAAYQAQKQLEPALTEALIAQKNHPNSYRVLNALGTVYIEMQRYAEAEAVYEKCLLLTPHYFPALKNRALNAFFQKKYADCIQFIEGMNWQGDEQLTYMLEESRRQIQ